jgi:hypothetical protein
MIEVAGRADACDAFSPGCRTLDCESVAATEPTGPCKLAAGERRSASMSDRVPIVHPKKDSTLNTVAVCAPGGPA